MCYTVQDESEKCWIKEGELHGGREFNNKLNFFDGKKRHKRIPSYYSLSNRLPEASNEIELAEGKALNDKLKYFDDKERHKSIPSYRSLSGRPHRASKI